MERNRLLRVVTLTTFLLLAFDMFAGTAAANPPKTCTPIQVRDGECSTSAHHHGGGVDVSVHVRHPGRHTHHDPGQFIGGGGSSGGVSNGPIAICSEAPLVIPCRPTYSTTPPVTISDLKHFVPRRGTDHMQPNGWLIVGLSTNFYATVPSELEHGTLLGQVAQVRFIPEAWHWTYGDGFQATLATPGATWAAQGAQDFDATPTSHVYEKKGTVFIDLDIRFGAEYEYAGGVWAPISGTIDVPANRLKASAGTAKTVLVSRDCIANPSGPGC